MATMNYFLQQRFKWTCPQCTFGNDLTPPYICHHCNYEAIWCKFNPHLIAAINAVKDWAPLPASVVANAYTSLITNSKPLVTVDSFGVQKNAQKAVGSKPIPVSTSPL